METTEYADLILMHILLRLVHEGKITNEEFDKVMDRLVEPFPLSKPIPDWRTRR